MLAHNTHPPSNYTASGSVVAVQSRSSNPSLTRGDSFPPVPPVPPVISQPRPGGRLVPGSGLSVPVGPSIRVCYSVGAGQGPRDSQTPRPRDSGEGSTPRPLRQPGTARGEGGGGWHVAQRVRTWPLPYEADGAGRPVSPAQEAQEADPLPAASCVVYHIPYTVYHAHRLRGCLRRCLRRCLLRLFETTHAFTQPYTHLHADARGRVGTREATNEASMQMAR